MGVAVQTKLKLVLGAVKDHASISKAMIYKQEGLSEIEIAIIRATCHDNSPIDDKYMHEILFLVSNFPESISFLAERISRRLCKTRDRLVALKTLMLIHRLLRGGNRGFEQQLRGAHLSGHLQMCTGPTFSSPSSCFLHNYAAYLEERMGWIINPAGKLEPVMVQGSDFGCYKERSIELVFRRLPKCQKFIDKVLECLALDNLPLDNLAQAAISNTLKESFQVYITFCEGIAALVDIYFDLTVPARALACDILKKASKQSQDLHDLYEKCKQVMDNRHLEYPYVQVIDMDHVEALETCLSNNNNVSSMKTSSLIPRPLALVDCLAKSNEVQMTIRKGKRVEDEPKKSGFTLFSCTMETKISNIWVVFEDDETTVK